VTATSASTTQDLLGLRGLDAASLRAILAPAARLAVDRGAFGRPLRGRTIANLFFEDSTRTRVSFTVAARALGADIVQFGERGSSTSKGESLIDTARTIEAMGVDALVVRHASAGAPGLVAGHVLIPVLNAGDGAHEHPTQGLLDILTLAEAHGRLGGGSDGFDLSGLRVVIVGDVLRSRVARSAIAGMTTLGASVVCAGPEGMCPAGVAALGCGVERDLDAVIGDADAVMALRVQFERGATLGVALGVAPGATPGVTPGATIVADPDHGAGSALGYARRYGLSVERAARMKPGAIVMHPGPMNRGLEIESPVADGPRSVVLRQVAMGVPVRMAALLRCFNAPEGVA
jgi:aspartate carbamoyltransferase catalytic subunit